MKRALTETVISGVPTTILYHLLILDNEDFIAGDVDTGFIPKHADELAEPPVLPQKKNKVVEAAKRAAKRSKSKALA
eukprot:jgi/Picre1/27346/NNA_000315.t1